MDNNTIIVEDHNTHISTLDRSSRQKINRETLDLNCTLDQMDLINIYRTFHPIAVEYTIFSSIHRILPRVDNIIGHKTSLTKIKIESK